MAVRKKIEYSPEFLELKAIYPKRLGGNPWPRAFKAYSTRIKQGYDHDEIKAGLARYAEFCDKTAKTGSEFVMQAATFFGPDLRWQDEYELPKETQKPEWSKLPFDDEKLWGFAKEHGFSDPGNLTYRQYRTKLQNEITARLNRL